MLYLNPHPDSNPNPNPNPNPVGTSAGGLPAQAAATNPTAATAGTAPAPGGLCNAFSTDETLPPPWWRSDPQNPTQVSVPLEQALQRLIYTSCSELFGVKLPLELLSMKEPHPNPKAKFAPS